jgi:hypothetical protein
VYSICAAQGMGPGQLAGVLLDRGGGLDRAGSRPEFVPVLLGGVQLGPGEVVVVGGRGERGTYLGVGKAAGDGRVASVAKRGASLLPVSLVSSLTNALASK